MVEPSGTVCRGVNGICDRADYEWSRAKVRELRLEERCTVLFSASHAQLSARQLADWILEDRLPVPFQLQLHKLIWDPATRGV